MTTKAAMNCWEVLEVLEGIDAGAIPTDDAMSTEAQRHLVTCPACQRALPQRLQWNAQVSDAMTAVALPPELESRLAKQLGTVLANPVVVASAPRQTRRWWFAAAASVAALVMLVVWQRLWSANEELLTRQTVDANIAFELSSTSKKYSSGRWQPELPMLWRAYFELRPDLLYAFPAEQSHPVAALVPFEFHNSRLATPIRGRLVMIPLARFHDPPVGKDFLFAPIEYIPGFERCVWVEGDWVYLCYVRSVDKAELRELQRLMRESSNLL